MLSEQREFETPPPRRAFPWLAVGVVIAAAGLLTLSVLSRRNAIELPPDEDLSMGPDHPAVGQRLDGLQLQPLTGQPPPLSSSDLQGRVTLLNFWGPWCRPCKVEFPHLAELEEHFRSEADFRFVSVSCSGGPGSDENMADETERFLRQQRADFPTHRDADSVTRAQIQRVAGQFAYPSTLVIGRDGSIRAFWLGYAPGVERQMRQIVEKALAELTVPVPVESASE